MPSLPTYPEVEFDLITDAADVAAVAEVLAAQTEPIAIDTETTGLSPRTDRIRLVQATIDGGHTVMIDLFATGAEALRPVWDALADPEGAPLIFHNAAFDVGMLRAAGCIVPAERIRCTMLAERCMTAGVQEVAFKGRGGPALEELDFEEAGALGLAGATYGARDVSVSLEASVKRRLGLALPKEEQRSRWDAKDLRKEQLLYAARDPHSTRALYVAQLPELEALGLMPTAELEWLTVYAIVWMMSCGMPVNTKAVSDLRVHLLKEEGRLRTELLEAVDQALQADGQPGLARDIFGAIDEGYVKPNHSPTFLDVMRKVGIDLPDLSKQTIALSPYLDHPVVRAQIEWKRAFSLSLYGTKLASAIEANGRVYCQFRQYGAGTGRMTSSQPINLQNIPRDGRFRDAFVAPEGWQIACGDYPTIEPRLIAEISNDKAMLESFRAGRDIYKTTAAALNDKNYDEITPAERKSAKPILLGLQYGMGAEKLARYSFLNYGVDLKNPTDTRDKFFNLYKGLKKWHGKIGDEADKGATYESRTPSGRRRVITGEHRFSAACNHPVQGEAASIMKLALVFLCDYLAEAGLHEVQLLSVVHDECLLLAPAAQIEQAASVLKQAMEDAAAELLSVPLSVDVGIGPSWGTAKV